MKQILNNIYSQIQAEYAILRGWQKTVQNLKEKPFLDGKFIQQCKNLYDNSDARQKVMDFQQYPKYRLMQIDIKMVTFIFEWGDKWNKKLDKSIKWYHFVKDSDVEYIKEAIRGMQTELLKVKPDGKEFDI